MIFVRRPRSSERLFGIRVLASVYLSSRSFSGSSECSLISLHSRSPSSWDACLLRAKHAVAAAAAAVGLLFGTEHRWIEALSAPRPSVRPSRLLLFCSRPILSASAVLFYSARGEEALGRGGMAAAGENGEWRGSTRAAVFATSQMRPDVESEQRRRRDG